MECVEEGSVWGVVEEGSVWVWWRRGVWGVWWWRRGVCGERGQCM